MTKSPEKAKSGPENVKDENINGLVEVGVI